MSHSTPSEEEVVSTLSSMKLSSTSPQKPLAKPKSAAVAESWEDVSSGSDTETETDTSKTPAIPTNVKTAGLAPLSTVASASPPVPPPPTPASPTSHEFAYGSNQGWGQGPRDSSQRDSPARRPEKTTAVAGRLIAGALGVRPPRRTEEERRHEKKLLEKEKKRREDERAQREAAEQRKKAIWDD